MHLDRALQREMLELLSNHYRGLPQVVNAGATKTGAEDAKYITNLLYLEEHGLIMPDCTSRSMAVAPKAERASQRVAWISWRMTAGCRRFWAPSL